MNKNKCKHCRTCDICIYDKDHHCGVLGKCIGRGNIWCFYLMFFWSFIYILFTFSTLSMLATKKKWNILSKLKIC